MIRKLKTIIWIYGAICMGVSCTSSRNMYDPQKKYSPAVIKADYTLFRNILETTHPSIYWYTPKDSMDYYFEMVGKNLKDSMTEIQFRDQLAYMISKLDCGHTTMKGSKSFSRYIDTASSKAFPFALKFWSDTVVITANLRRNDPILQRGTIE